MIGPFHGGVVLKFTILRMYGPLSPWIDKTWRPSEIELVTQPIGKGGLIEKLEEKVEKVIK